MTTCGKCSLILSALSSVEALSTTSTSNEHGFALLAAVGTRAGDIDEMQLRAVRQQRIGHRQRHIVGKGAVIGFVFV